MLGNSIGQALGLRFGTYLGKQITIGACREDADEVERRPFRSPIASTQLPGAIDLRPWMTPVEDQGQLGSCTSNAAAGALEYLIRRETGAHQDVSRLFVYYNQRLIDDRVREDTGASISSSIQVLSTAGVPLERSWPYHRDLFAVQPPEEVYREASGYRVTDWWSVPIDGDALRGALAAGFPVMFGTRVTESFVQTGRDGICAMPTGALDKKHGRHALLLCGYDDSRRVFVVRNSWGDDWGHLGYCYMPYGYILNREWTSNAWAVRLTTRDAFDPAEHRAFDIRSVPKAPPQSAQGGSKTTQAVGSVAAMGARTAIGALTGSSLLASFAGGLVAGITPGVAKAVSGRDAGSFVGRDRAEEILALLHGQGAAPSRGRVSWDDGFDEEAVMAATGAAVTVGKRGSAAHGSKGQPRPFGPKGGRSALPAGKGGAPAGGKGKAAPGGPKQQGKFAPKGAGAGTVTRPAPTPPVKPLGKAGGAPAPAAATAGAPVAMPTRLADFYQSQGGPKGPLGPVAGPPTAMVEGKYQGTALRLAHGGVFLWSSLPDAASPSPFALRASERTFARWLALGASRSPLGWPRAGVMASPDGQARVLYCARGAVYEHPRYGVWASYGTLYAYWQQLGGPGGELGYPVTDPVVPSDPTRESVQRFAGGTLGWSAARGAYRE